MAGKGSKVGFWVAIIVLVMLLFGSCMTNLGLVAALFAGPKAGAEDYPVDDKPVFEEIWSHGYGETKVVRIALSGVIMRGQRDRLFGYEPDMVTSILSQIRAATIDPSVRAILLEVDSPGGAVTPSDEIYAALLQFKMESEGRVIMVFIRDLGASGAYYASMAGDSIFAEPTSIVGSVGVIMQTMNLKGLGDKLGLSSVTITSGENKDMLNPFKVVDTNHVALLQELVNSMQNRFASIVETARNLENRTLLDGRIFTAGQALDYGLIDGIGYWQDAVSELMCLLDADDLFIVRYVEKKTFFQELMGAHMPRLPGVDALHSPRLMYLWKP